MDSKKLEFLGTVILPEFTGNIGYEVAFSHSGITPSRLFKTMLFKERINNLPAKKVDCYRARAEINNLDLATAFGERFLGLDCPDPWRLFQLNKTDSEIKFSDRGACNTILVNNGQTNIWHAQIFWSRANGWKAELYTQPKVVFGELIFVAHPD